MKRCKNCDGTGYILRLVTDTPTDSTHMAICRCIECHVFDSDNDAVAHVFRVATVYDTTTRTEQGEY